MLRQTLIEIPVMVRHCGRIFCLVLSALLSACVGGDYVPCTGDLVFQTVGGGEFSEAISASTSGAGTSAGGSEVVPSRSDGGGYAHVGIVVVEEGRAYVLEAEPRNGVVMTPWEDFVSSSPLFGGKPGITVMRLTVEFPVDEAIDRAKSHLGEPYDWHFLADNGKIYCSELVYDSYLYADGSHIFTAVPMRFRDSEGNMPEFWIRLFDSFGESVPEGLPGTNPDGLSREAHLKEVHRFF